MQIHDCALTSLALSPDGQDLYCGFSIENNKDETPNSSPLLQISARVRRFDLPLYSVCIAFRLPIWFQIHNAYLLLIFRMGLLNLPLHCLVLVKFAVHGLIRLVPPFIAAVLMEPWPHSTSLLTLKRAE